MQTTNIVGIGIDLITIDKMNRFINHQSQNLHLFYSKEELDYCFQKKNPIQHLAVRFAAKEATLKSLGIGIFDIDYLSQISIQRTSSGKPLVKSTGKALEWFNRRKIKDIHISMSHCKNNAIAFALALTDQ